MPFTGDTNKIEHTHAELRQQNCACWIWNSVNVPQLSMHKSHWIHRNPLVHKSPWWLCIHLPTCFTTDLHQWQQHKRACMSIFVDLCVCLWPLSLLQIVCMQMHRKQQGRMSLSASALKAEVERWREKPAQDWRWTFVLWDCSYIWCLCYTASCSEVKTQQHFDVNLRKESVVPTQTYTLVCSNSISSFSRCAKVRSAVRSSECKEQEVFPL